MCSNNIIFKLAWQKIDIPAAHFSLVRVTRFGFLSFCYKIRKKQNFDFWKSGTFIALLTGLDADGMKMKSRQYTYTLLYTLLLLWKLWVVKSMQSIFNYSMWSWHDNPISGADIESPCQVQSLLSFQAPRLCFVLNFCKLREKCLLLQIFLKKCINKITTEFGFCMI